MARSALNNALDLAFDVALDFAFAAALACFFTRAALTIRAAPGTLIMLLPLALRSRSAG